MSQVREARSDEAERLTALAMRAKASWGYDAAFMAQCRAELTLTPEKLAAWTVWVAECDGELAGMIALAAEGPEAELEDFMVEPRRRGQGVGARLLDVLLDACRRRHIRAIALDADPHAEAIYHKLGFELVGRSPSRSIPGRTLPRMRMSV